MKVTEENLFIFARKEGRRGAVLTNKWAQRETSVSPRCCGDALEAETAAGRRRRSDPSETARGRRSAG